MSLSLLDISGFRNLLSLSVELGAAFNIICGPNGSGKSSFIEAIHYLGLARSFRSHLLRRVINNECSEFAIHGVVSRPNASAISIGIQRSRFDKGRIRIAGQEVHSTSALAEHLPLQLINTESYRLLDSGPKFRRQFLDWGVFHVKHEFLEVWRKAQLAISQRNAALKSGYCEQIDTWNNEVALYAEKLDVMRASYIEKFKPIFLQVLSDLSHEAGVSLDYYRGWDREKPLLELLVNNVGRDRELGYTSCGPHRADLRLRVGTTPVHDVFSRGQQKLVVCALSLAQGLFLREYAGKQCVYLIDDLAAELDAPRRESIVKILAQQASQVFITGIERSQLSGLLDIVPPESKMFHVKHGEMTEFAAEPA